MTRKPNLKEKPGRHEHHGHARAAGRPAKERPAQSGSIWADLSRKWFGGTQN